MTNAIDLDSEKQRQTLKQNLSSTPLPSSQAQLHSLILNTSTFPPTMVQGDEEQEVAIST